ncbi:MAG: hypothetical protein WDA00_01525 [Eubacteriales bacterium]
MKRIVAVLKNTCLFSTVVLLFFYSFMAFSELSDQLSLNAKQFLVILLFAFVIAVANELLALSPLPRALGVLLHYLVLATAYFVLFLLSGNIKVQGPATIFVHLVLFSLLYALCRGIGWLFRRLSGDTKPAEKSDESRDEYRQRFQ